MKHVTEAKAKYAELKANYIIEDFRCEIGEDCENLTWRDIWTWCLSGCPTTTETKEIEVIDDGMEEYRKHGEEILERIRKERGDELIYVRQGEKIVIEYITKKCKRDILDNDYELVEKDGVIYADQETLDFIERYGYNVAEKETENSTENFENQIEELKNSMPQSEIHVDKNGVDFKIECGVDKNREVKFIVTAEGQNSYSILLEDRKSLKFRWSMKISEFGKIGGIRLDDDVYQQVINHKKSVEEHIANLEKAEKDLAESITIDKIELYYDSSIGYRATELSLRKREDVSGIIDLLNRKSGKNMKELLEQNKTESGYGDYNITETYVVDFRELLSAYKLDEGARSEKEQKRIDNTRKLLEQDLEKTKDMSLEQIAMTYFTETIQVDEDGYFAKDEIEDIFNYDVWKKDVPEEVRRKSRNLQVSSRRKTYTYKQACDESAKIFAGSFGDILVARKEKAIKELEESINKLK